MSVFHIGTLHAKPEATEALIESLSVLSTTKGCLSHKVFRGIEDSNRLISYEEWEKKEDHDDFLASFSQKEMEVWIGMLSKEPEDSFYEQLHNNDLRS